MIRPVLEGLKDQLPAGARRWVRQVRGNYRIEHPAEPALIAEIVSPLRYDILIRARHFLFHAEHEDLFDEDVDHYADEARRQPYYLGFTRWVAPLWLPHLVGDPVRLEQAWRERLNKSAELHASFRAHGFDAAHSIDLRAGHRVDVAPTGKRTRRHLCAGGGCHRMSLLLLAGQKELAPSQYHVKRYRTLVPLDSTGLLCGATGAGWSEYAAFIALGYPGVRLERDGTVVAPNPATRAEVEAVVAIDRPHLT